MDGGDGTGRDETAYFHIWMSTRVCDDQNGIISIAIDVMN